MTVDLKTARQNDLQNYNLLSTREDKFYYRFMMYQGDYKDLVIWRMKQIYAKASDIKMDKQIDLTNNIFKTVIEKISRVYSFGVDRDIADENLSELYKNIRVTKFMKDANRYLNAFNDVLIQVAWVNDNIKLIFRLPHKTRVELDDNDNPIEVEYFVEKDDKLEKWAYWSAEEHYYKVYDSYGKVTKLPIDGNEKMINPYGVLPFVFMQKGLRDGHFFDVYSGDDLFNITVDNAIYNTFKNYLIKWQTFKQLVVTGDNVAGFNGQMLDPSTALTAEGENIKIDILDLQSNIKQLNEVLNDSVSTVSINYNISPNQFRLTGSTSSGFALKMENLALDEFTKEEQSDFKFYEKDLFNLILLVSKTNGVIYKDGFNITFNEPTYPENRNDLLDMYQKSIDLGLKSPIEIIEAERGITEEEATIVFNKNISDRNTMLSKVEEPKFNINTTIEELEK